MIVDAAIARSSNPLAPGGGNIVIHQIHPAGRIPERAARASTSSVYTCNTYMLAAMGEPSLGEAAFLVLTALTAEPQHGYAVIEDIHRITEGRVRMHAGTLYATLDRLRTSGLIEVDREEIVQSRLRRYYRLTTAGAQRLAEENARLRHQVKVAEKRLRRLGLTFATGGRR